MWGLILWEPKTRVQCPEQWHCCVLSAVGTCYTGSRKLCFLVWWNKSCSYLDHHGFFEIFRKGQGWMPLLFSLLSSKGSTKYMGSSPWIRNWHFLGKALFSKAHISISLSIYIYLLKVKCKPCILFTSGPCIRDIHLCTSGCKVLE